MGLGVGVALVKTCTYQSYLTSLYPYDIPIPLLCVVYCISNIPIYDIQHNKQSLRRPSPASSQTSPSASPIRLAACRRLPPRLSLSISCRCLPESPESHPKKLLYHIPYIPSPTVHPLQYIPYKPHHPASSPAQHPTKGNGRRSTLPPPRSAPKTVPIPAPHPPSRLAHCNLRGLTGMPPRPAQERAGAQGRAAGALI